VQPDRPSVLCLLPTVPVAANTGGALRALGVLRALDKAFRVTVVARRRENEEGSVLAGLLQGSVHLLPHPTGVAALLKETSGVVTGLPAGYCRYGGFSPVLKQLLETQRFDFVHFDHPHAASAWPQIKRLQPRALLVLDAHNVEAEIVEQLAESAPQWQRKALRWQAARIRELERELAHNLDLVLTCSEKDAATFREMGARRVRVVPNAIPPLSPALVAQRRHVVFVGSLDWRPNADAAAVLAKEIWPRCRKLLPGARLLIVGRNPPSHVRALASNDVVVEGDVASVRPHLDRAFATAIPLRVGSGTRIKILEAWAAGVPVVASGIAAEGLPHSDGVDLILAERPSEFARALVRLWRDRRFADNLAREGARTVEPFTVEKIGEAVENDYRELLAIQGRPMQRMDANKF
jgi:glycosyltransferase involved in cell wall biosynthesis